MLEFQVEDMTCGHCAGRITQAVKDVDANASVVVDLQRHLVQIDAAGDSVDFQEAIRDAGYTPVVKQT